MKRNTLLFILLLQFAIVTAQDYEITFAGAGASSTVDSVLIENLTQGTSIKLSGTDTLFLTKVTTGINSFNRGYNLPLRVYPNPFSSECKIEFPTQKADNITVRIFDLSGRLTASKVKFTEPGNHQFQINGIPRGMYIVQVHSAGLFQTAKILSYNQNFTNPEIKYQGFSTPVKTQLINKSASGIRKMVPYYTDDNILLMASNYDDNFFVSRGITMNEDVEIENSAPFIFEFVPCIDPDGRTYSIVKIGNQTWMSENYAYETENGSWIYDDDESRLEKYGRLYTWEAARNNAPDGWHLPSDKEWKTLEISLGLNTSDADSSGLRGTDLGSKIKSNSEWENGSNSSGFSAFPAGARYFINGSFYNQGTATYWWTSTLWDDSRGIMRKLTNEENGIRRSASKIEYGFSARYIKDKSVNEGEVQISGMLDESLLALINVEKLKIRSVNDSSQLMTEGSFEINSYQFEDNEQPPLFFTKEEEVLFGYYPTSVTNNTVTIDDIMHFFLDVSSDIRRMELPKTELIVLATASSYYNETTDFLIFSFQNNVIPADNQDFVASLKNLITDIILNHQNNLQTKSIQAGTYQFEFQRDGTIKWENKVPTFASLGLEIRKADDNTLVYGPKVLEHDGYMFSPSSVLEYGLEIYMDESILDNTSSFKLKDEGVYNISLCNNKVYIFEHNRNEFKLEMILLFLPKSLFKPGKKGDSDCIGSMIDLVGTILNQQVEIIGNGGAVTSAGLITILKDLQFAYVDVVRECGIATFSKCIKLFLDLGKKLDVINIAEAATNLSLLLRDTYLSTINDFQPRYFYDEVSFNELTYMFFSSDTLKGAPQDIFLFTSNVFEKEYTFDFERGDGETLLKIKYQNVNASGLPFKLSRNSGNAEYGKDTIQTLSGVLKTTLKMGTEDSQIKIEPAFKNSGLTPDMVEMVVNIIIPEFDVFGPYCEGDEIPVLPVVSNNGITGSWTPEINNSATTEYSFIPGENQGADTVTTTITIQKKVIPSFDIKLSYKSGDYIPELPVVSFNDIVGTWLPAINQTTTTTYTFTPEKEQCADSISLTITITEETSDTTLVDARDNRTYKSVTIGNQIWMAENLKYLPQVNKENESSAYELLYYVYDYSGTDVAEAKNTANFQNYGALYNWPAASTACPQGWRLPTNADWDNLAAYIAKEEHGDNGASLRRDDGSWRAIGKYLKEDGTNKYGFNGRLAGRIIHSSGFGFFSDLDKFGYWWSGTTGGVTNSEVLADFWEINYQSSSSLSVDTGGKNKMFSVRCIKE